MEVAGADDAEDEATNPPDASGWPTIFPLLIWKKAGLLPKEESVQQFPNSRVRSQHQTPLVHCSTASAPPLLTPSSSRVSRALNQVADLPKQICGQVLQSLLVHP